MKSLWVTERLTYLKQPHSGAEFFFFKNHWHFHSDNAIHSSITHVSQTEQTHNLPLPSSWKILHEVLNPGSIDEQQMTHELSKVIYTFILGSLCIYEKWIHSLHKILKVLQDHLKMLRNPGTENSFISWENNEIYL